MWAGKQGPLTLVPPLGIHCSSCGPTLSCPPFLFLCLWLGLSLSASLSACLNPLSLCLSLIFSLSLFLCISVHSSFPLPYILPESPRVSQLSVGPSVSLTLYLLPPLLFLASHSQSLIHLCPPSLFSFFSCPSFPLNPPVRNFRKHLWSATVLERKGIWSLSPCQRRVLKSSRTSLATDLLVATLKALLFPSATTTAGPATQLP